MQPDGAQMALRRRSLRLRLPWRPPTLRREEAHVVVERVCVQPEGRAACDVLRAEPIDAFDVEWRAVGGELAARRREVDKDVLVRRRSRGQRRLPERHAERR